VARLQVIFTAFCCCVALARAARADTFTLNNGTSVSGDIISFDQNGVIIRQADGSYSERTPWGDFSQPDLRELVKNPKMQEFVEPFIEPPLRPRAKPTPIPVQSWPQLQRPQAGSLLGALFSSGVGLVAVLLIYVANIFAGTEIAIFRSRPKGLVAGLAAIPIVGFVANIAFLAMAPPPGSEPATRKAPDEGDAPVLEMPRVELVDNPLAPTPGEAGAEAPAAAGGLKLAHESPSHSAPATAEVQVFQAGAFTFNRRFFETKFPGFFGVVRRESEKHVVLEIKSRKGLHVAQRISRISSNDVHIDAQTGHGVEEVSIPFSEIQEIKLKPKDA